MNVEKMIQTVKTVLYDWKQLQKNGVRDLPIATSSSSRISLDLLIQKISLALKDLQDEPSTDDPLQLFHSRLQKYTGKLYSSFVQHLPADLFYVPIPSPSPTPTSVSTTKSQTAFFPSDEHESKPVWRQFRKMMIILQKKATVDGKPIFRNDGDVEKLFQAKSLQLQASSSSIWPFLRSQFPDAEETFLHYANILNRSFILMQTQHPQFDVQSILFHASAPNPSSPFSAPSPTSTPVVQVKSALMKKMNKLLSEESAKLTSPSSAKSTWNATGEDEFPTLSSTGLLVRKTAANNKRKMMMFGNETSDLYLEPKKVDPEQDLQNLLPENILIKVEIQPEDRDPNFEDGAYLPQQPIYIHEVEDPAASYYHHRKHRRVLQVNNPVLSGFDDLETLQRDLMHHASTTQVVEEGKEENDDNQEWNLRNLNSNYVVNNGLFANVCSKINERRVYDKMEISIEAAKALSEGIQLHLRNMVDSLFKKRDAFTSTSKPRIQIADIPSSEIPLTFPKFRNARNPNPYDQEDIPPSLLAYDIFVLDQARKKWALSGSETTRSGKLVVPALPTRYLSNLQSVAFTCIQKEQELALSEAKQDIEQAFQELGNTREEGDTSNAVWCLNNWKTSIVKNEKLKQQESSSSMQTFLVELILKHSSASLLPATLRTKLKLTGRF